MWHMPGFVLAAAEGAYHVDLERKQDNNPNSVSLHYTYNTILVTKIMINRN